MIWGEFFVIDTTSSNSRVSRLGKTIQTLTRIVDGRARKSDSQEGWAASTLYVPFLIESSRYLLKYCS